MTSTTKTTLVEKEAVASGAEVKVEAPKGCKPTHEAQRAQIGGGYLVCSTCSREIPNVEAQ